jgi:hypothetical protein
MYTKEIWVTYRCKKCRGYSVSSKKYIDPTPIDKLQRLVFNKSNFLDIAEKCACGRSSAPVHIECEIISEDTLFGTMYSGSWKCELDHIQPVYPIPLKRAFKDTGFVRYNTDERYRLIAATGYPWQCPVCHKTLVYEKDRRY